MASAALWPMACDPLGGWLGSRLQPLAISDGNQGSSHSSSPSLLRLT